MNNLIVTSPAFEGGGNIPLKYSAYGENLSIPLKISGIAPEVKFLAIIIDDPDAPSGTFTHWIVWNIPAGNADIPENVTKTATATELGQATQGQNGTGAIGYYGPRPPSGTHTYMIKVYGLDEMLNLRYGTSKTELEKAMTGHILRTGLLKGKYSK